MASSSRHEALTLCCASAQEYELELGTTKADAESGDAEADGAEPMAE